MDKTHYHYSSLQEIDPFFLDMLTKEAIECGWEIEKFEHFDDLIDFIRESYTDHEKDRTDSMFYYTFYSMDLHGYTFTVTGEEYIKDQSICDMQMQDSISITNIAKAIEEEKAKKEAKLEVDKKKWSDFFQYKGLGEIIEDLSNNYKFPTKFKK